MSILINKNSKIICQGITGRQGSFHTEQCIEYGTKIVGGVTPGSKRDSHLGVPVFDTAKEAVRSTQANVSMIYVPAPFAADAIIEAADAGIELVVCITEGIPVSDMVKVKATLKSYDCLLVGPNCPGIITVGECKLGIMPGFICKKGRIGVISKSGTLTYEAIDQLVNVGLGQTTAIGIGGDPIIGTPTQAAVEMLMNDPETEGIVMIGEIGGDLEPRAARWIKEHGTKPVVGFIAGETAPKGRTMGHAGAIVSGEGESAEAKKEVMRECGIHVVDSPAHIGPKMAELMGVTA